MKRSAIALREKRAALLCMAPALLLYLVVVLGPQLLNLAYSFTDYDGFDPAFSFVGAANFLKALSGDPDLVRSFIVTVSFSFFSLLIGLALQFFLAYRLHGGMAGGNFLKGLLYLPSIISMIILSLLWNGILKYNGILNNILISLGLVAERADWLGNPRLALLSLIFVNAWTYVGYGTIIFLAGLNSIPPELLESADLDGAVGARRLFGITLPLMMNSITVSLFVGLTGSIKVFDLPFVLTKGGPIKATTTIAMQIYKEAFEYQRFGYSSAIAVLFTAIIGILTVLQLRATRAREMEY
jgi:raffinose/stachyose/melibiose transport system permease protein